MNIDNLTAKMNRDNEDERNELDVNAIRNQRQRAFREVDYSLVANAKAVNGYSSIPASPSGGSDPEYSPDELLTTGLIDISNYLGAEDGPAVGLAKEEDNADNTDNTDNAARNEPANRPDNLFLPQAGLHRDGEQARLVEKVRQRQQFKQQQQQGPNSEESALQWFEDSVSQNIKSLEHFLSHNMASASSALEETFQNYGYSSHSPLRDGAAGQTAGPTATPASPRLGERLTEWPNGANELCLINLLPDPQHWSAHPRALAFGLGIYQRLLLVLRACVDAWFARVAHLDPLDVTNSSESHRRPQSSHTHPESTPKPSNLASTDDSAAPTLPIYSLQFTTDDILLAIVLFWVSLYYCARTQMVIAPGLVALCFLGLGLGWRIVRRINKTQHFWNHRHLKGKQRQPPTPSPKNTESRHQEALTSSPSVSEKSTPVTPENSKQSKTDHIQVLQRLQQLHPRATHAECRRFFTCVKFDEQEASLRIDDFLKWRMECGLKMEIDPTPHNDGNRHGNHESRDENDWREAVELALSVSSKSSSETGIKNVSASIKLPQILFTYEDVPKINDNNKSNNNNNNNNNTNNNTTTTNNNNNNNTIINNRNSNKQDSKKIQQKIKPPRCHDGTRILHILPARIDLSLAPAPIYALATALYVDRKLHRSSTERLTLLCDVRGGRGWANPTPWSTFPFIQSTSSVLGRHYPERLERMVLFPMPKAGAWIWNAARKFLDPNTASKVRVCAGGAGLEDKWPEEMMEFLGRDSLSILEDRRRSTFAPK